MFATRKRKRRVLVWAADSVGGFMPARKREVIQPKAGDKRYARRDKNGQFSEDQVAVGKSLAADRRTYAKKVVPKGQGDRGDQKKS
jgi:hypothetical protein